MKKNMKKGISKTLSIGFASLFALGLGSIVETKTNSKEEEMQVAYKNFESKNDEDLFGSTTKIVTAKNDENFYKVGSDYAFEFIETENDLLDSQEHLPFQSIYFLDWRGEEETIESEMIFNSGQGFLFDDESKISGGYASMIDYSFFYNSQENYYYGVFLWTNWTEEQNDLKVSTFYRFEDEDVTNFETHDVENVMHKKGYSNFDVDDIKSINNIKISYSIDIIASNEIYEGIIIYNEDGFIFYDTNIIDPYVINEIGGLVNADIIIPKYGNFKPLIVFQSFNDTVSYIDVNLWNGKFNDLSEENENYFSLKENYNSLIFNSKMIINFNGNTSYAYVKDDDSFYHLWYSDKNEPSSEEYFYLENEFDYDTLTMINNNVFLGSDKNYYISINSSMLSFFDDKDIGVYKIKFAKDENFVSIDDNKVNIQYEEESNDNLESINYFSPISDKEILYSSTYFNMEDNTSYSRLEIVEMNLDSRENGAIELIKEKEFVEKQEQGIGEYFSLENKKWHRVNAMSYEFSLVFYDPGRRINESVSSINNSEASIFLGSGNEKIYSTNNEKNNHGDLEVEAPSRIGSEIVVVDIKVTPDLEYLFRSDDISSISYSSTTPMKDSVSGYSNKIDAQESSNLLPTDDGARISTSASYFVSVFAIILLLIIILSMVIVMFSEEREEYAKHKEEEKNKRKLAKKNK